MKKIITALIVAIMAVTAANADIASTTYVTSRTGTVSFDSGAAKGKTNLTDAIKAVDTALGTTTGNAATKSELEAAQSALQGNIDKKVDNTTYSADKTVQAAVDKQQTEDIGKLDKKIVDELEALQGGVADELATMNTAINAALPTETFNSIIANYSTTVQMNTAIADNAVNEVKTGTANGTILVDGAPVAVHGLGSAAYTDKGDYATAAQGAKADAALPASSLEKAAKKAAGQGDGEYALTMKVVNNVINYQWDKVSY